MNVSKDDFVISINLFTSLVDEIVKLIADYADIPIIFFYLWSFLQHKMDVVNDTAAAPPPPVFAELDPEIVEKALDQARAEQEKKKTDGAVLTG